MRELVLISEIIETRDGSSKRDAVSARFSISKEVVVAGGYRGSIGSDF